MDSKQRRIFYREQARFRKQIQAVWPELNRNEGCIMVEPDTKKETEVIVRGQVRPRVLTKEIVKNYVPKYLVTHVKSNASLTIPQTLLFKRQTEELVTPVEENQATLGITLA